MADFFKIGQAAYGGGADVSKAIGEGLKEAGQTFKSYLYEWQKKERAWKESVAPKLAKIGEDYSPTLVDEGQRATMTAALQESRLKYADILKQTRNMDPTSEEYISLMGQATDIVAGFNKTFELGQEFTQLGNEFALLAQNDNLSRGMSQEKSAGLSQIFVKGKYKVKRDPVTGEMTYIVTENIKGSDGTELNIAGMEFTHDELDDFRQPNQTFVNGYLAINESFSKFGEGGKKLNTESAEYKSSAFELQKAISGMSIEELRSLATDNFIDGKPVAVFSNEEGDIFNMTKEQLGPMVYEKLMNNLLATNAANYQDPTPPPPPGFGFGQGLKDDILTSEYLYNEAVAFGKVATQGDFKNPPAELREQKTNRIAEKLKSVMPLKDRSKLMTRSELYNLFLEEKGYEEERNKEGQLTKESKKFREEFKSIYGDSQLYFDSEPILINTDNESDLTNLYLDLSDISMDVRNFYKSQYRNLLAQPTAEGSLDNL